MDVIRRVEVAQKVTTAASTAFTVGASAGAAAGAAAAIGLAKPGLVSFVISAPFKIINAPFYYLLGGHASDKRLKVLEIAASNMKEAQTPWFKALEDKVLIIFVSNNLHTLHGVCSNSNASNMREAQTPWFKALEDKVLIIFVSNNLHTLHWVCSNSKRH
jgi:hypothetical protein